LTNAAVNSEEEFCSKELALKINIKIMGSEGFAATGSYKIM
jgi:hypothetical protein